MINKIILIVGDLDLSKWRSYRRYIRDIFDSVLPLIKRSIDPHYLALNYLSLIKNRAFKFPILQHKLYEEV
jgi:hypothetical protein